MAERKDTHIARPDPYRQAIVDSISCDTQSQLLDPLEDAIINERYRARPPLTFLAISHSRGIPLKTIQGYEMRAVRKLLRPFHRGR